MTAPTTLARGSAATVEVQPIRVWDLPTRVFHWSLLICVVGAVVSAKIGGNAMVWHGRLGLAVGALLVFRLLWGVVGGRWSRFSSFIYSPATVLRYLRGQVREGDHWEVGHNPLGSLSVWALLVLLLAQVGSGLVGNDEIAYNGPLVALVSEALSLQATSLHKTVGQYGLMALVVLHVGAIVFYRLRKGKDLVGPMVRGDKLLPAHTPPAADGALQRALAVVLLAACVALAAWVAAFGT